MVSDDDFAWDYRADPKITAWTIAQWRVLAARHGEAILAAGDGRVVSVGGGGENWVGEHLADRVDSFVTVDPSLHQVASARYPDGARTMGVLGDGEHLPIAAAWADVVDMSGVIDHFDDPPAAFAEAARVLRPGGTLTITLTNDGSWYRRLARRFGRSTVDGVHHGAYAVADVVALAEGAGFCVTGTTTVAYLRLPLRIEHTTANVAPDRLERLVERVDGTLRRLLGPHHGGMMLVTATRA